MTTEEFLKLKNYPSFNNNGGLGIGYCHKAMIEFAKYHVEQALKEASENADFTDYSYQSIQTGSNMEIDKNSILNAYSLENIK